MALTVGELVAYLRADDKDFNGPLQRARRALNDVASDAQKMGSRMDAAAGIALRAANNIAKIGAGVGAVSAVQGAVAGLSGVLGVIPGIAAAAAAAIATIKIGTSGLGKAISGLSKSGGGGGGGGGGAEKAISDARRIADAERGVQRAHEQVQYAQESLTRARERAGKEIEDLQRRLKGQALDEESAALAVERARERLNKVRTTEGATGLDMREAELGVRQAEAALADTKQEYKDLGREAAEAMGKGVEGSDEVIAAQRGIQDAARGLEDAQRSLAEAHQDAARGAAAAGGGAGAANEEFDKLSPNAKAVALAIHGLADEWLGVKQATQDALFAGIASDIKVLGAKYLPVAKEGFSGIAFEMNRGMRSTAAYLAEARQVKDVQGIFVNVRKAIASTSDTAKPLTSIFLDILAVSSEFLPQLSGGFAGAAQRAAEFIREARETGKLKEWIQGGLDALGKLWQLLKNIGSIVGTVWKAFDREGAGALDTLIKLTERVKEFLKSAEGQQGLKALAQMLHNVSQVAGDVLMEALRSLFKIMVDLGPAVSEVARVTGQLLVTALQAATPLLQSAAGFIKDNADWLVPLIVSLYAGVKAFEAITLAVKLFTIASNLNPWVAIATATIALVTLIITNWDTIKKALGAAWDWIATKAGEVWGWIKRNIIDNITAAAQWVGDRIGDVIGFFRDLPGKIWQVVKDAGTWLIDTGKRLIQGLIDGITKMIPELFKKLNNLAVDVVKHMTGMLKIGSPSKVFRDIGIDTVQGYIDGIDKLRPRALDAVGRLADDVMIDIPAPRIDPTPLGGGGPGGIGDPAQRANAGNNRPMVVLQPDGTAASAALLETFREAIRDQGGDIQVVIGS